ncbi:MAG: urease accessory protein UreD [Sutterellaceae bacterium]|nr:urease accessory protein UreD [Burkholderiaceae bacterium]MDW8428941.1 urease accessory protein UreD [Sutterellaceae bacterium]
MAWQARLSLGYRRQGSRTVCARQHQGPLLVQKALYPEGPGICHSILVHPPGGIAGGDQLTLDVVCEEDAHALLTTPAATKWYKSLDEPAAQHTRLQIRGALEWLPQEAIVFDAAQARTQTMVELAADAAAIGWEMTVLARGAMGERFTRGSFTQTLQLYEDGHLLWLERMRLNGGDALLASPVGLGGARACGCLWAYSAALDDAALETLRTSDDTPALTRLSPRLLVARMLASSITALRTAFEPLWMRLRPLVFAGLPPQRPRIWAT